MPEQEETREQFVIRILPETKARLEKLSGVMTTTMTKLVEQAGATFEKSMLNRLKSDEHRKYYLQGVLSFEVAFGRRNKLRGQKSDASARTAVLSMRVAPESKAQIERYSKFVGLPLADVIDRLSIGLEKRFKGRYPPDPEPQQQPEPLPANAGLLEGVS